jgi:peptide/nickel transport system permease protein
VFRYLIRRLMWAWVLFVAVTIVTYVIFYAIPANPARLACGQRATPECIKRAAHYLGTDRPLYVQYGKFFGRLMPVAGIVQGNPHFKQPSLGRSFTNRQTVNSVVLNAAPVTASLVFGGAVFWMLIALPVGILSALRPRSLLDRIAMVFVLIGISAHPVWIGLIFAYFFGFKAGLFPITGYACFFDCGQPQQGPVQWAYHLVLPWATFAILFAALYVRMIRANVMEALGVARHALPRAPQRALARRDDARHGYRHRTRRRDLHRVGLRAPRARQDRDQCDRFVRPADDSGSGRVRDALHHFVQPDRRLALRGYRSTH